MREIKKGVEPKSLTQYRSSISHSDLEKSNIYEDFKNKTKNGCLKQSYQRFIQNMNKRGWTSQKIKQDIAKYKGMDSNGKYYEFCAMTVYFLIKYLKSKGVSDARKTTKILLCRGS